MSNDPKYYTITEAASIMHIAKKTLRNRILRGEIKPLPGSKKPLLFSAQCIEQAMKAKRRK